MFTRNKGKGRPDDRYRLVEVIGEGGMGVVWKAFDQKLGTQVAVKTLVDVFDNEAFERFQDECKKLAGLPHHPNIIRIMDVGEIEQDKRQKPFFVMPLLEGATLGELLQRKSMKQKRLEMLLARKTALADFLSGPEDRLPVSRIIEIICQTCKGLQVAHENGIIHRDIKPSNVFVLSDFSVQIIDFGVARRANGNSGTIGWKGTLPYMSPEQVQFKPLTTASDIFSLAVVCYEALVGERPFIGRNNNELAEAIVSFNPKVPHEVAPVKVAISQAVYKALAKQSDNRYLTASDFGEHLNRALSLGDKELFPLPRPRLTLASDYHAKGNDEAALKLLVSLQVEGISHPEITELREQVDSSLRRKRIDESTAAGRSLMEVRDYDQATRELNRVLVDEPTNAAALALLREIDTRRADEDVEELFRQMRRQMDDFDFETARRTLDRVRKRRPKEPRILQFSTELERIEEEYQHIQLERQRHYDAARSAWERRDISSARSHVRKLEELESQHPDVPNPRQAEFNTMRTQVAAEQSVIESALAEISRLIDGELLASALEICLAQLAKYPSNEHFLRLQFQIEELLREALAETIKKTDALLRAEPDLLKQETLLESRTQEYPAESHFRQALERTRKLRTAVEEIATRARTYEGDKSFAEAQQEWQKLRTIYPRYPGLDAELERVGVRRVEQERRQRKEKLTQQIHRNIDRREFRAALEAVAGANREFPDDREIAALEALARSSMKTIEDAQALLRRGSELCAAGNFGEGLPTLRQAYSLDRVTPAVGAGLVEGLLAHSKAAESMDPDAAEKSLTEALEVDPDNSAARDRLDLMREKRHDEKVTECIANTLDMERNGDLGGALRAVELAIREYGMDRRLVDRKESLQKKLGSRAAAVLAEETSAAAATAAPAQPPSSASHPSNTEDTRLLETWSVFRTVEQQPPRPEPVTATIPAQPPAPVPVKQDAPKPLSRKRLLTPSWQVWAAAGALIPILAVAVLLLWRSLKPIPAENAIAAAVVQIDGSRLLKDPQPNSSGLMTLLKGQRLMILERVAQERPFVRAQFVSRQKNSRPGYVRREDLGEWSTDDAQFAWDLIRLSPPGDNASIEERLRFAEQLMEFSRRFPNSSQADEARIEAAHLYWKIASELKNDGKPSTQTDPYIANAEEALGGVSQGQKEEVDRMRGVIAEWRQAETQAQGPPPPREDERARQLKAMYQRAALLYNQAKNDEAKRSLEEILRIDPHYDPAIRLKASIEKVESILGK